MQIFKGYRVVTVSAHGLQGIYVQKNRKDDHMDYSFLADVEFVGGLQKWLGGKLGMGQSGTSLLVRGARSMQWEHAKVLADLSDPKVEAGFYMDLPVKHRQRAIHYYLKKTFMNECRNRLPHNHD